MRSPACGSPETSRTLSLSRTPSIVSTALLLIAVSSSGQRLDFKLDDIRAAMLDPDRHAQPLAGLGDQRRDGIAVAPHLEDHRLGLVRGVEHPQFDRLILADNAKARRLKKLDAAVALAFMAGDQRMQRRLEAERIHIRRNIVDKAVRDHEHAADALGRHIGEARVQRRKQPRAVVSPYPLARCR